MTGWVGRAAAVAMLLATAGCGWMELGSSDDAGAKPQVAIALPPPLPPPVPKPQPGGAAGTARDGLYRVKQGDTLYSVAEAHEVDAYALANANGLVPPFALSEGQRLSIPGNGSGRAVATPATRPAGERKAAVRPAAPAPMPPPTSVPAPSREPRRDERSASLPPPREPLPQVPDSAGGFVWPVQGRVLSGFGAKGDGRFNDGINIAAAAGTPVRATESGVVAYAGNELRAFGNMLLIRHADGWISTYAHNQELLVRRGERVSRGQVIARVGSTGGVSQPQLHFELRRGKRAVDPLQMLRRANAERKPAEPAG